MPASMLEEPPHRQVLSIALWKMNYTIFLSCSWTSLPLQPNIPPQNTIQNHKCKSLQNMVNHTSQYQAIWDILILILLSFCFYYLRYIFKKRYLRILYENCVYKYSIEAWLQFEKKNESLLHTTRVCEIRWYLHVHT